ncbi:hypothetical protein BH23GEM4_BH23GEM4_20120 [soil metagenome]
MAPPRTFLLSPAHCGGKRAAQLLRDGAGSELARRLRSADGAPLGEVFRFISALYFRGKLAYARAFGDGDDAVLVITPTRGLLPVETRVGIAEIREFAAGDIDPADPLYREPLEHGAARLARSGTEVVLLGSIASGKYVDVLVSIFGERLLFPIDFVGRGDMSRGGLLLRSAQDRRELAYRPVAGAVRRGQRPPKLAPRR